MALQHALSVMGWLELPDDEQPSEQIWLDDEELKEHFERVKHERENKYKTGKGGSDEVAPMDQNELTRGIKQRARGR